jgi:hypothetical protein
MEKSSRSTGRGLTCEHVVGLSQVDEKGRASPCRTEKIEVGDEKELLFVSSVCRTIVYPFESDKKGFASTFFVLLISFYITKFQTLSLFSH